MTHLVANCVMLIMFCPRNPISSQESSCRDHLRPGPTSVVVQIHTFQQLNSFSLFHHNLLWVRNWFMNHSTDLQVLLDIGPTGRDPLGVNRAKMQISENGR